MRTSTRGFVSLSRYESHEFVRSEGTLLLVAVVAKLGRRCPRGATNAPLGNIWGAALLASVRNT